MLALKIGLFLFGLVILFFAVWIISAVISERKDFKRMAKLHERNQEEINKAINRVLYDCEAE